MYIVTFFVVLFAVTLSVAMIVNTQLSSPNSPLNVVIFASGFVGFVGLLCLSAYVSFRIMTAS